MTDESQLPTTPPTEKPKSGPKPYLPQEVFRYNSTTSNTCLIPGKHDAELLTIKRAIMISRRCLQSDGGLNSAEYALRYCVQPMNDQAVRVSMVREWLAGDRTTIILSNLAPTWAEGVVRGSEPGVIYHNYELVRSAADAYRLTQSDPEFLPTYNLHLFHLVAILSKGYIAAMRSQLKNRDTVCSDRGYGEEKLLRDPRGDHGIGSRAKDGTVSEFDRHFWGGEVERCLVESGNQRYQSQIIDLECVRLDGVYRIPADVIDRILQGGEGWQAMLPFKCDTFIKRPTMTSVPYPVQQKGNSKELKHKKKWSSVLCQSGPVDCIGCGDCWEPVCQGLCILLLFPCFACQN